MPDPDYDNQRSFYLNRLKRFGIEDSPNLSLSDLIEMHDAVSRDDGGILNYLRNSGNGQGPISVASISGLQEQLEGKASTSDLAELQTTINSKQESNPYYLRGVVLSVGQALPSDLPNGALIFRKS